MAKKKLKLKPLQSTQQNIPIADVNKGLVIAKDGTISKMLEIKPIPFMLMNAKDQNAVWASFINVLKSISADSFHFKSLSLPADLSNLINEAKENMDEETSLNCKKMDSEYIQQLQSIEEYSSSHKFFLSFPYVPKKTGKTSEKFTNAFYELSSESDMIINYLNNCGNEVVTYGNPNEETLAVLKVLYQMYNRNRFHDEPFETRVTDIYSKYYKKFKNENFFIPPSDIISPKQIMFLNSRYVKIDDTYYAFLYITANGYNDSNVIGWMNRFINSFTGVDVDIFVRRQNKSLKQNALRRTMSHSLADYSNSSSISVASEKSQSTLTAANYLLNGIQNGQDIYDVATIISVTGTSIEMLEEEINRIKRDAHTADFRLYDMRYQCEEVFNAVLPCGQLSDSVFNKLKRNMLTEGLATMYPFTAYELIQDNGIPIAESEGSPVIPDFFNRAMFTNPHVFISGTTGAGKSVTIMTMALRARQKHYPTYILAPEKQDEFKRLCAEIGGQFISIGSGSKDRLNIFEIFMPDRLAMRRNRILNGYSDEDDEGKQNPIEAKLATLQSFFKVYMQDDYTLEDQDIMSKALIKIYNDKGIYVEDENSLWADQRRTRYKKMPIMEDLYNVLDQFEGAQHLKMRISVLTKGAGSYFNGETNVDVNNEFFVVGLQHNTDQFLGLAMFTAMEYVWDKICNNQSQRKMLIMDEWWKMAYNKEAAERSMKITRLARALGCSVVIATQKMSDIMAYDNGKYGDAVFQNCDTKIIMKLKEGEIPSVKKLVGLTPIECSSIVNFSPGEALFIAGKIRLKMKFTPTKTEQLLMFTDDETKKSYIAKQRKRIEEEKRKKEIANAKSFEETFVSDFGVKATTFISNEEFEKDFLDKKAQKYLQDYQNDSARKEKE